MGSHHSKIPRDEFQGMAIADNIAPLIVINPNDARAAQVFTFIHELSHLWMGLSGVSNIDVFESKISGSRQEFFCNRVAAEFLVPEDLLLFEFEKHYKNRTYGIETADSISRIFKVSGTVINRRLFDLEKIAKDEYEAIYKQIFVRWKATEAKQKEKQSGKDGGPGRNIMDKYRLGDKTTKTFADAINDGKIGLQDAARLLNVPVSRFGKLSDDLLPSLTQTH